MTRVFLTIDTEYEPGFTARRGPDTRAENYARSIACGTPDGEVGVAWQAKTLSKYGLKAVFFVDPLPGLLWGADSIADVLDPILRDGHDAQLHAHAEWLALVGRNNPLGGRTGVNLKDFTLDEQTVLIGRAAALLEEAGAPRPVAFRAGNYGANDDTLRALAANGLAYDSSHCPALPNSAGEISLDSRDRQPLHHCGVIEVPVGCIGEFGGSLRHAQLTALSIGEMKAAIRHARDSGQETFTLVSHSFELLCRKRRRVNTVVRKRFEKLCAFLRDEPGISTGTYSECPPTVGDGQGPSPVLPANPARSGWRYAEQALSNALYG